MSAKNNVRWVILTGMLQLAAIAGHHPSALVEIWKTLPHAGDKVYQEFCATCHAKKPVIATGAPRFREQADWGWRLQSGCDIIFASLLKGRGVMPARGGCFECSDQMLKDAMNYMLPKKRMCQ